MGNYFPVRGGGLEPPWLLTASTSNGIGGLRTNDFAALQRQETSILAPKRPILAQLGQNSECVDADTRMAIARALTAAIGRWTGSASARELRVQLLRILATLEAIEP